MGKSQKRPVPVSTAEAPIEVPSFNDLINGLRIADERGIVDPWAAAVLSIAEEVNRIRSEMKEGR